MQGIASDTTFDMPDVWRPDRRLEYSSMEVHLFRKPPPVATAGELLDTAPDDD